MISSIPYPVNGNGLVFGTWAMCIGVRGAQLCGPRGVEEGESELCLVGVEGVTALCTHRLSRPRIVFVTSTRSHIRFSPASHAFSRYATFFSPVLYAALCHNGYNYLSAVCHLSPAPNSFDSRLACTDPFCCWLSLPVTFVRCQNLERVGCGPSWRVVHSRILLRY